MATLPTYTHAQCHAIYDRINLPSHHRHDPGNASRTVANSTQGGLEYLTALQQHFLLSIPFENLELHYSSHKTISVDPAVIFSKIIAQGTGRGGYCMENNMLFATFLRSLGFRLSMTGGKVSDAEQPTSQAGHEGLGFTGFGHQVTIVRLGESGRRYLVDVGFGNGGPTTPMLLEDGAESVRLPPNQKARMVYRPGAEDPEASQVWIYERTVPGKEDQGWLPSYCFPDGVEFTMKDFGVMSHFTSTSRTSFFTYSVICSRFVAAREDGDEDGEIAGHVTLFGGKVKKEIRGVRETVEELGTEGERVRALREWLEVGLDEVQRVGIRGMVSALPA